MSVSFSYNGSGTIVLSGGLKINSADFVIEKDFNWSSSQTLNWYRVEGKCIQPSCVVGNVDPGTSCNMSLLTVVAAKNLTDLCNKLKQDSLNPAVNWPLQSIRRYSRPAYRTNGPNTNCQQLTEETFCEVPACLQFCVDYNFLDIVGITDVLVQNAFGYDGFGTIIVRSPSFSPISHHHYHGFGELVLGGSSSNTNNLIGVFVDNVGTKEQLNNFAVNFGSTSGPNLSINQKRISACSCTLPLTLNLTHNLNNSSQISDFLERNNFALPQNVDLLYKSTNGSWQQNYHFTGSSIDGTGMETWTFAFDFSCVELNWQISVLIRRNDQITRAIFGVLSNIACTTGVIKISFSYDIRTGFITNANKITFFDGLDVFGTNFWPNNKPEIVIFVTENQLGPLTGARKDISSIFPTSIF